MLSLSPTRLFTGTEMIEGATVHVREGKIVDVVRSGPPGVKLAGTLAPGLIDVQVNGGGGVLFNDAPTVETLRTMAAAHAQFAVTGIMATLISDARGKIAAAIDAVTAGIAEGIPGLVGLHLEGPWLSTPKRGVHPDKFLRGLDAEDMKLLAQRRGFPVMATVSPEQASPADVKTLSEAGVLVCIGHTAGSAEDIEALIAAGERPGVGRHLVAGRGRLRGRRRGRLTLGQGLGWCLLEQLCDELWHARVLLGESLVRPHARDDAGAVELFECASSFAQLGEGRVPGREFAGGLLQHSHRRVKFARREQAGAVGREGTKPAPRAEKQA